MDKLILVLIMSLILSCNSPPSPLKVFQDKYHPVGTFRLGIQGNNISLKESYPRRDFEDIEVLSCRACLIDKTMNPVKQCIVAPKKYIVIPQLNNELELDEVATICPIVKDSHLAGLVVLIQKEADTRDLVKEVKYLTKEYENGN